MRAAARGRPARRYKVGLVYSKSGPLATLRRAVPPGVHGRPRLRDQGHRRRSPDTRSRSPSRTTPATRPRPPRRPPTLIGQGAKIIAGSTASGVALQVAPLAKDNKVLFISGPAAADAVTGANRYTFRSGRQTYQDVDDGRLHARRRQGQEGHGLRAGQRLRQGQRGRGHGDPRSQGRDGELGARPRRRHRPDAVRHPGQEPEAGPAVRRLGRHQRHRRCGRPSTSRASSPPPRSSPVWTSSRRHALFGAAGDKIDFLAHFFDGAADNEAYKALDAGLKKQGASVDLFTNDGFVAAQMVVRALTEGGAGRRQDGQRARGVEVRGAQGLAGDPRRGPRRSCSRCSPRSWSRTAPASSPQLVKTLDARGRRTAGHAVQVIGRRPRDRGARRRLAGRRRPHPRRHLDLRGGR